MNKKPKIILKEWSRPATDSESAEWTDRKILQEFLKNPPREITREMMDKYKQSRTKLQFLRRILKHPVAIDEVLNGASVYLTLAKIKNVPTTWNTERSLDATKTLIEHSDKQTANILRSRVESLILSLAEDNILSKEIVTQLVTMFSATR